MFAMQISSLGSPLKMVELQRPNPKPDEIQIRVKAVGINFADLLITKGKYQVKPDLPFSPGMEICGLVSKVGSGIKDLKVGSRVLAMANYGGLSEFICLPRNQCVPITENMSDEVGAGFIIAYGTSYLAIVKRAKLMKGENFLVLGASGGVGRTAVEIGSVLGANVIAVASNDEKLQEAKIAGATHLIHSGKDDLREKVKSFGGADVVYDPVGGSLFHTALRSMNPEGRIIPIGFASGEIPSIPANLLLVKNLDVIGCYWSGYLNFKPSSIQQSLEELFHWFRDGKITPHISAVFQLDEANKALRYLENRKAIGKVIVKVHS